VMRALLLVLALAGCATVNGRLTLRPTWWPAEDHGGDSGRPAASDLLFIGAGATFDAGLQLAHVRPVPRALADVTAALLVRTWKPLGRTEGSHFTFGFGAELVEFVGLVRHITHRSP
jgi:hypothetical protein